jgi:hypothetical protein
VKENPMRVAILLVVVLSLSTSPAAAQPPYVAASAGVDVSRLDHTEGVGGASGPGGEAVAFALRLGVPLGARWGVELAYTRPAQVTSETSFGFPIPLATGGTLLPGLVAEPAAALLFPSFDVGVLTERRNTTLDAAAWLAQDTGTRVTLVYLAGLSFSRITETVSYRFPSRPIGITIPTTSTRTTSYGVGPVVGFDARIGLTDHVIIVPGLRLHAIGGIANGWLVRAATGLGWTF